MRAPPETPKKSGSPAGSYFERDKTVTLTNASYNGSIAPNASITDGFQGSWTNSDAVPTGFTLNGATCTT